MADLFGIGLSALLAQQRALATTSNNVANASTPGYSRQRTELSERPTERLGNDFVGTGVTAGLNRRITDDLMLEQVRTASTGSKRADALADLATTLDNLLGSDDTGLNATLQSFTNALHGVANDPSSLAARQSLLAESGNTVARFQSLDQRLTTINDELRSRVSADADQISALGASIAELNKQVLAAGANPSPDLLDKRDQMLEDLSGLVQVSVSTQRDGTIGVFIGSGQVLVLGTSASKLVMTSGNLDPSQPQLVLRSGSGPDVPITQFLTGGELGGLLDFNREMLAPTRAEVGRIAVGLADAVNTASRNGMDLDGQLGGAFFSVGGPQTFAAGTNSGSGAITATISNVAALDTANYQLSYNGTTYTLQRTDTGAVVPMTGTGTAGNPFVANGISIVVSGTPAAGDQFLIKPLDQAAGSLKVLVTSPGDIAAAAPTRTSADLGNTGSGAISAGSVIDVTNPNLLATATIQFSSPTTYSINGAGAFAYTPGGNIDINGTRVQITGAPAQGDVFVVQSNTGGSGDNRNALAMLDKLAGNVFNGNVTLKASSSTMLADIGAKTAAATSQQSAQSTVLQQSQQRLDSLRGVNLDEEAANMLRYQQLYQAAAQTISVAGTLFSTLLAALQR
jgi:flagellar hook-associated protein 1 FlgK